MAEFWNVIYNICLIGCIVCLVVAVMVLVASEIQVRKFRREIEAELKKREEADSK